MGATLPPKKYRFGKKARDEMFNGIHLMRECVTATLGPNGRNVVIDRYMVNDVTKDGVTALGAVVAEDNFEEMGCKMVREASTKTNDEAGDGTTTAIEIAHAASQIGKEYIEAGTNVIKLQTGMQLAMDKVIEELDKQTIKGNTAPGKENELRKLYEHVATISAQDSDIGRQVADIFLASGENGVIDIERTDKPGIETEHTDGMQLHEGWLRHEFINDWANGSFAMSDIPVILTDRELTAIPELGLVNQIAKSGIKKVLIICEDCNGEALATLANNARLGMFHACVVKAPAFGPRKAEILKDIAAMTGATVISEEAGLTLDQANLTHVGHARQVTVKQRKTIIIADKEREVLNPDTGERRTINDLVKARIEQVNSYIASIEGEGYEKDKAKERLASLTDGVSLIKLGANTEIERILMKRRVEDAIRAVQCAKEEGVVAGGGAALLHCVGALERIKLQDRDEQIGVEIIKRAIQAPARRILEVAGVEPEPAPWYYRLHPHLRSLWRKQCQSTIVNMVMTMPSPLMGYDMGNSGYAFTDLFVKGVIDPKKVVRTAFVNGASCAKTFLGSEVAITPIPEKDPVTNSQKR